MIPGHSSLDQILSVEEKIRNTELSNKRKRLSSGKFEEVDKLVYDWLVKSRNEGKLVPGYSILEKANTIAKQIKLKNFNSSRGWLAGFKERFGLIYKKLHGEAGSVDTACIEAWL